MKELRQRQRIKRLFYSWPVLGLAALVTLFLLRGVFEMMIKERQSARQVRRLEDQAAALVLREAELGQNIEALQTEEGTKALIREKFSVTEEGEYMAIIVDEKPKAEDEAKAKIWYKRWWSAIISGNDK